jgi:hypothetical protein
MISLDTACIFNQPPACSMRTPSSVTPAWTDGAILESGPLLGAQEAKIIGAHKAPDALITTRAF